VLPPAPAATSWAAHIASSKGIRTPRECTCNQQCASRACLRQVQWAVPARAVCRVTLRRWQIVTPSIRTLKLEPKHGSERGRPNPADKRGRAGGRAGGGPVGWRGITSPTACCLAACIPAPGHLRRAAAAACSPLSRGACRSAMTGQIRAARTWLLPITGSCDQRFEPGRATLCRSAGRVSIYFNQIFFLALSV
jgi:hypothetical protein